MSSRIVVKEDGDPLLTIRLKKKVPGGGTVPYLLDGNPAIEFYVKEKLSDAMGSALFNYTKAAGAIVVTKDGAGVGDKYSEVTIQCSAAHLVDPAVHYFHLDVIKANKRDTVMHGFFEITDI
jgi:hypothetical protein